MNSRLSAVEAIQEAYLKLKNEIISRQENERRDSSLKPITDANYKDAFQYALLHYAVLLNDPDKIQYCVEIGADINLKKSDPSKILSLSYLSPIQLALQNNAFSAAQYLYDKNAYCHSLYLPHAKNSASQEWIKSLIQKEVALFKEKYKNTQDLQYLKELGAEFKFLQATEEKNQIEQIIIRIIEAGDFDYLKKIFSDSQESKILKETIEELKLKNNKGVDFPVSYSLMQAAAASGNIEIAEYLIAAGFKVMPETPYKSNAMQIAIFYHDIKFVMMLIENISSNNEMNYQDRLGNTPLMYAVMSNQIELVKLILQQGAEVQITNIDGNTVLHFAAKNKNQEMIQMLKEEFQKKGCSVDKKNIYGQTYENMMLENNLVQINQMTIMARLDYFCRKEYKSYVEYKPKCSAFADMFLFHGSSRCPKIYYDELRCMSLWSGDESELNKKVSRDFTLREILESWCKDIKKYSDQPELLRSGYQSEFSNHSNEFFPKKPIKSELVDNQPVFVFSEWRDIFPFKGLKHNKSRNQQEELMKYLLKMPFGMHIKLEGDAHATGIGLNESSFKYYDPNHSYETCLERDSSCLTENIIHYKYIRQNHFDTLACPMYAFYSAREFAKIDFNQPIILPENEIPKSKDQAVAFQKNSPNGFTPLHIAILTRQTQLLDRLLKDGFCDPDALDFSGRSPIVMAILSHSEEMVLKLMPYVSIRSAVLAVKAAYHHESTYFPRQKQICATILKQADISQIPLDSINELRQMLNPAISANDLDIIKMLFNANRDIFEINKNWPESRVFFPFSYAILIKKIDIAMHLLERGADFFRKDSLPPNNRSSFEVILNPAQYSDLVFSKMCEIMKQNNLVNQFQNGILPIEMAIKNRHVDACKKLIESGADLFLKNKNDQAPMDHIHQSTQDSNASSQWLEFVNELITAYSSQFKKN